MDIKFNPLVISLFSIIYDGEYDALIELAWIHQKHPHIDEYHQFYKNKLFKNLESPSVVEETQKQVFNICLYIHDKIIPQIIKDSDKFYKEYEKKVEKEENIHIPEEYKDDKWFYVYKAYEDRIQKYKFNLESQVANYVRNHNSKKYILKEYDEWQDKKLTKEKFIINRTNDLQIWAMNPKTSLSEFLYVDDLQKNQINIVLSLEPAYLFLEQIYEKGMDELKLLLTEETKKGKKKKGGQVPYLVLVDGILRPSPFKMSEEPIAAEDEENVSAIYNFSPTTLTVRTPKRVNIPELNVSFDYKKDVIHQGTYELMTLTSILQIGREQIQKGNSITFTFGQICEELGLQPSNEVYKRIAQAIFYLKLNLYTVKISDDYERIFNIISAIEKPIFNSNREKEWTIEIDNVLREQILQSQYAELFAADISAFRYELTAIMFKMFLIDKVQYPDMEEKEYTLKEITNRALLKGKPAIRKTKIINSLNEMKTMTNSIINDYTCLKDNTIFNVKFNKDYKAWLNEGTSTPFYVEKN